MKKEQWQSLYDILDKIYSDFSLSYPISTNGKNEKIRSEAYRKVENAIHHANNLIQKNIESYILLTGSGEISDYHRNIIYEDFLVPYHFGNAMRDYLRKIQELITTLE